MKHKVGDVVRIKSREWYEENKNESGDIDTIPVIFTECMAKYCGKTATIVEVDDTDGTYNVDIDDRGCWWTDEMFEGGVEDVAEDTNSTPSEKTTNDLADTSEKKSGDNDNSLEEFKAMYPIICLADKLEKIKDLTKQPNVDKESIKDSWRDLTWECILTLRALEEEKRMKKINELAVTVSHTIKLSDVEVSEEVYKSLDILANKGAANFREISSEDETIPAFDWLSEHIRETDAVDSSYEIKNLK